MLNVKIKNVMRMLRELFSKESRTELMRGLFSKANRTRLYIIGSMMLIAFAAGTFWPNFIVKKNVAVSATDTLKIKLAVLVW